MPKSHIMVVGAGISGLTAAWRLRNLGHDVVVLESADHVGGKLATTERDGFRLSRGAAVYSASYSRFLALAGELGLEHRIAAPEVLAGVMRDGRTHWVRGSGLAMLIDFLRTPLISFRSKLLLGRLVADAFRNRASIGYDPAGCAQLDTESVWEYCTRRLNPELRDHLIIPLIRAVWVVDGGRMSVADLYVLLTKFLGSGLRGHVGGMDFLARALGERLDVRTSACVTKVEDTGGEVRVSWTQDGVEHDEVVDGVVLSVGAPDVPPICPNLEPEMKDILLGRLKPANYAGLRFALKRAPEIPGAIHAAPKSELPTLGTIVFEHNLSSEVAPPGKGLVAAFLSADWAESRLDWPDDYLIDAVLPDLEKVVPGITDLIEFVEINRWWPATLRSETGMYKDIERLRVLLDDGRRIQHAGDYLSVGSVEGSVVAGEAAACRLAATLEPTA